MKAPEITAAIASDRVSIVALLAAAGLPNSDLTEESTEHFLMARDSGTLCGFVGLELYGPSALLRSLVVVPEMRGRGIGKHLCNHALTYAQEHGVKRTFLLTTTAENFFSKLGFTKWERGAVPQEIQRTSEFSSLCPDSAACMAVDI
jgi:amino-acid N-acetyltransferase